MLKSRKQKFVAPVMGLPVADVVSAAKTRFAPWANRFLNPQLKEVRMLKKILLLMSSVMLVYGLGVTSILAQEKVLEMWISSNNSEWSEAMVEEFNKEGHGFTMKLTIIPVADFLPSWGSPRLPAQCPISRRLMLAEL